jgi:pimeloyl-ACP methyl ester carboxylesterase
MIMFSSMRVIAKFFVLLPVLALIAGPAAAVPGAGPSGEAFYLPPAALGVGAHGDLIWSRPLTGSAVLPDAARNVLVLYRTTGVGGLDVAVSGTVAVPAGSPPPGGWPLISWAHGTTGDAPLCAPSRDVPDGPMNGYFRLVDDLLDGYVRRGYAVVQTDYEGVGTPGVHPFLVGVAEARDVVDIVRAARQLDARIGARYVVMGHSQGGQSALFAAADGPAWAPELSLLGTVAFAPASHLVAFLQHLPQRDTPDFGFAFAGLMIRGFAAIDPAVRPEQIFTPATAPMEAELASDCLPHLMESDSWAGLVPARTFVPNADFGPLLKRAAENDPGALHIVGAALVVQGTADKIVPPIASDLLDGELCANGTAVTYESFDDATHFSVLTAAQEAVRGWVDDRFAGKPAAPNCGLAPQAAGVPR